MSNQYPRTVFSESPKVSTWPQLGQFDFVDLDRVGIYGHSGGGFMSTAAMPVYPDFFHAAVSSSGPSASRTIATRHASKPRMGRHACTYESRTSYRCTYSVSLMGCLVCKRLLSAPSYP